MERSAVLSPCRTWRYTLTRCWNPNLPRVLFGLLNPSKADETEDDPTLRRGMGFARSWGYGSVVFVNEFAFRATDPADMKRAANPIGPENDHWIYAEASKADRIVIAWGAGGGWRGRDAQVLHLLRRFDLYHLGLTKKGYPRHPLYLRADTPLEMCDPHEGCR